MEKEAADLCFAIWIVWSQRKIFCAR